MARSLTRREDWPRDAVGVRRPGGQRRANTDTSNPLRVWRPGPGYRLLCSCFGTVVRTGCPAAVEAGGGEDAGQDLNG